MKNRLEVAREFLRDDGVIFIQCDDNEQAYLKVLCDEIFGRENFVAQIAYQGMDTIKNDAKYFSINHEYILCFAKNKLQLEIKGYKRTEKHNSVYRNLDNDVRGDYLLTPLHAKSGNESGIYFYKFKNGIVWSPPRDTYPRFSQETLRKLELDNRIYFGKNGNIPQKKTFLSEVSPFVKLTTFWDYQFAGSTRQSKNEIRKLELLENFGTPKPEKLLNIIIEACTQPGDLVMDFFAGSGTTLAVAHKMGRRWVGIEQMDYIENITKERLCKVILGEQGGVSKAVGWNPLEQNLLEKDSLPNAFVYAELMPLNETYKKLIIDANEQSIYDVIARMQKNAFLDYRVDFARAVADGDFLSLSLDDKKKILLQCLDSNLSYVPFSEIKDSEFGISDEVIGANEALYKGRNQ